MIIHTKYWWWFWIWKNALLNLIKQQNDQDFNIIAKIYVKNVKNSNKAKCQYLNKNMKKPVLNAITIQKLLLNIPIICRVSIKIWTSATLIKNVKFKESLII